MGEGQQVVVVQPKKYPNLCVCMTSCEDHANYYKNLCCGCMTSYTIAKKADMSTGAACGCFAAQCCLAGTGIPSCLHGCVTTQKLRAKYGFEKNGCCACMSHFCCSPCALTQEEALVRQELERAAARATPTATAPVRQQ